MRVDNSGQDIPVEGLFACGEAACVSVHGANRLGGNSLLDLIVFGRAAGIAIQEQLSQGVSRRDSTDSDIEEAMAGYTKLEESSSGETAGKLRIELQEIMQNAFGVFRTESHMLEGLKNLMS